MYCSLGIILVLSSLFMSYQNIDKKIFTNFNRLLNNDQKQKYQEIIKERISIYITGLLLGLTFGLISVSVPWFFYLPVTGNGFIANKKPNPTLTKLLSTSSHVVVGIFLAIGFSLLGY